MVAWWQGWSLWEKLWIWEDDFPEMPGGPRDACHKSQCLVNTGPSKRESNLQLSNRQLTNISRDHRWDPSRDSQKHTN